MSATKTSIFPCPRKTSACRTRRGQRYAAAANEAQPQPQPAPGLTASRQPHTNSLCRPSISSAGSTSSAPASGEASPIVPNSRRRAVVHSLVATVDDQIRLGPNNDCSLGPASSSGYESANVSPDGETVPMEAEDVETQQLEAIATPNISAINSFRNSPDSPVTTRVAPGFRVASSSENSSDDVAEGDMGRNARRLNIPNSRPQLWRNPATLRQPRYFLSPHLPAGRRDTIDIGSDSSSSEDVFERGEDAMELVSIVPDSTPSRRQPPLATDSEITPSLFSTDDGSASTRSSSSAEALPALQPIVTPDSQTRLSRSQSARLQPSRGQISAARSLVRPVSSECLDMQQSPIARRMVECNDDDEDADDELLAMMDINLPGPSGLASASCAAAPQPAVPVADLDSDMDLEDSQNSDLHLIRQFEADEAMAKQLQAQYDREIESQRGSFRGNRGTPIRHQRTSPGHAVQSTSYFAPILQPVSAETVDQSASPSTSRPRPSTARSASVRGSLRLSHRRRPAAGEDRSTAEPRFVVHRQVSAGDDRSIARAYLLNQQAIRRVEDDSSSSSSDNSGPSNPEPEPNTLVRRQIVRRRIPAHVHVLTNSPGGAIRMAVGLNDSTLLQDYDVLTGLSELIGEAVPAHLTPTQLNRIPVVSFSAEMKACEGGAEMHACQICMSEYELGEQLKILPCLHRYHSTCVAQWLKSRPTCPICREDLRKHLSG